MTTKSYKIKELAQELPKYGRYGDSIVAHINPQEAALLKSLGGSGTINPTTGLPEYWGGLGKLNPVKAISKLGDSVGVSQALTKVFQPVEKAVVQPVSQGLASFDKAVGNTIPGGWGTLGTIAASMIPGGQFAALGLSKTAAMTGLGALTGSGVLRPGRGFNLQGAVMGGAMAYGMSNLADYAAAAGGAPTVDTSGALTTSAAAPELLNSVPYEPLVQLSGPTSAPDFSHLADLGYADVVKPQTQSFLGKAGDYVSSAPGKVGNFVSNIPKNVVEFADKAVTPSTYTDFGNAYAQNVSDIGSGIGKLLTTEGAGKAAQVATGINPMGAAGATMFGATGLMALNEQEKLLKEQLANQQIAQAEYDQALGEINRQRDYAAKVVQENPFKLEPTSGYGPDKTLYPRTDRDKNLYEKSQGTLYAAGGSVDDELGGDYSAMGMDQGNMQRGLFGMGYKEGGNVSKKERQEFLDMINLEARTLPSGRYVEGLGFVTPPPAVQGRLGANIDALGGNVRAGASGMAMMGPDGKVMVVPGMMDVGYRTKVGPGDLDVGIQRAIQAMPGRDKDYAVNANYRIPFAKGGQPRFLSGGGDGMSDSIPATIEDKQQARLADGEFVIPADVVSHLGNGSSKAGAKRLYAMMDRVRQERTGTTKQGKEINPRKFMPA